MGQPPGTGQEQDQRSVLLLTTMPSGRQRLRAVRQQRLSSNGNGRRLRGLETNGTGRGRGAGQPVQDRQRTTGRQRAVCWQALIRNVPSHTYRSIPPEFLGEMMREVPQSGTSRFLVTDLLRC